MEEAVALVDGEPGRRLFDSRFVNHGYSRFRIHRARL